MPLYSNIVNDSKVAMDSLIENTMSELNIKDSYDFSVNLAVRGKINSVPHISKKVINWRGKNYYLLGIDGDGIRYYLEEGKFECDWYWGMGYVKTFSNNKNPHLSRDISSHSHFDNMFFGNGSFVDEFKAFFIKSVTLTDDEIWKLLELMKSLYTIKEFANMCHSGSSNITSDKEEYNVISENLGDSGKKCNDIVIPNLLNMVYKLLS